MGPRLAQQIQSHINHLNYVNDTMKRRFIPYISKYEITETVKSLKNNSSGWDFIPAFIAKLYMQLYGPYIIFLYHQSNKVFLHLVELSLFIL